MQKGNKTTDPEIDFGEFAPATYAEWREAAVAALTAAGLNADDYKIEVKADETKAEDSTVDADVVIVGAGGAGMTAAITAAAEGKSVVIVESQPMVYVTESGSVYHRKLGCSYLNLSFQQISGSSVKALKNAYGEKYQACELCSRGQEPAGVVYITKKSNRFHNRESCSALKRSVRMVKETEVSGEMSACGRCG